jgi:cell wall-associated NlpC family hydrolase
MIDIDAERRAVVVEARAWLRTPYHHMGRVKGAGVDCATLLAEVYARAGVIAPVAIPFYPPDWHLHRDAERYLGFVLEHAREIASEAKPKPADLALWRFGRCFSHGAIVIDWPLVIHAYAGKGCVLEDVERARWLSQIGERGAVRPRPVKFFRLKRWISIEASEPSSIVTPAKAGVQDITGFPLARE